MTITISKTALQTKLQSISKVIPSKTSIPQLGYFLFEAEKNELTITGANEAGRVETIADCISDGNIKILVPISILDCLKNIPEQPIDIIVSGEMEMSIRYHGGKFNITLTSPDNYPKGKKVEEKSSLILTSKELCEGINKVIDFAANDDLRPTISSIYIDRNKKGISFVATNAHSMGIILDSEKQGDIIDVIISRQIAYLIKSILQPSDEDVAFYFGEEWTELLTKDFKIQFRNIEGKYPNYLSVVPTNNNIEVKVKTSELLSAIKRTYIISSKSYGLIEMNIAKDNIILKSKDIDFSSSAEESVSAESNQSIKIGVKGDSMIDILENIDCEYTLMTFSEPSKAILISPETQDNKKLTYLLMPLTINA